ncbi:DUF86 domain-containing protein [Candidatus Margulisiibacteriota bacterium]
MSNRNCLDFILDIINETNNIKDFTEGMNLGTFVKDAKTINAVIRSLEVIGEATKKIPDELRNEHKDIPWKRMAGMQDKLIHEYFGVDLKIVWAVCKEELPPLTPFFDKIRQELNL